MKMNLDNNIIGVCIGSGIVWGSLATLLDRGFGIGVFIGGVLILAAYSWRAAMRFDCCVCHKKIWFFQRGMRLKPSQEESITGRLRLSRDYVGGLFAHERCFFCGVAHIVTGEGGRR